jgi:hypothetical protein
MTPEEKQLMSLMGEDFDSFDNAFESAFAGDGSEAPLVAPSNNAVGNLRRGRNQPVFSAQFDLSLIPVFYNVTVADGTHAVITPANLLAAAKVQIPSIFFGNSDYATGFAFAKQKLPLNVWTYSRVYVYGSNDPAVIGDGGAVTYPFPAEVKNQLQNGDMVIELYYDSGGVTDNKAVIIHRCQQVAYGTLLDSVNSDRFVLNKLRYTIPDTTKIAQYGNQIRLLRQSLFGRNVEDFVSPQAQKSPEQFQNGVIDIDLKKGIDKETLMATYVNYDVGQFDWSIFVWKTKKVLAK